jgi:hypothetical protein
MWDCSSVNSLLRSLFFFVEFGVFFFFSLFHSEPLAPKPVSKMLLTNDLTEPVMKEAINEGCSFIVSYHPPIFNPLKR